MNEIRRQVTRVRRRLVLGQFLSIATWCVFSTVLLALVAILLPRFIAVPLLVSGSRFALWSWAWLMGGIAVGIVLAIVLTCLRRRSVLDAAIEVDRRCRLKERVSSVVGMDVRDLQTPSGQALVEDAAAHVSNLDIARQFRITPGRFSALPVLAIMTAVLVVCFIGGATQNAVEAALALRAGERHVKEAEDQFRKQIARQRQQAEEQGLKDAARLLREIEQQYQDQGGERTDRKRSLIRLNNVKKKAEQLKKTLAKAEDIKERLGQIKNLQQGPADQAANAIKNGDFNRAKQEMQTLAEQLRSGEMSDTEQERFGRQLAELRRQLNEHERAKQELRNAIDRASRNGETEKANALEDQLNRLAERDPEMQPLKDLADSLNKAQQNLQEGNRQQAAGNLDDVASQLQQMRQQLDQLDTMDQLMDKIAGAKNAMNCKDCQGQGCQACQGNQRARSAGTGQQGDGGGKPGTQGTGAGQGAGARPESETEIGTIASQIDGNPRRGEVVRTGAAGGPNVAGRTREAVKSAVDTSLSRDPEPVNAEHLPRAQREHAKEYFRLFREGSR